MKYSYDWIQSHIEETLPSVESLKETIIFHAFEVESVEKHGSDSILDIKVLPDRAGDCLSHYGMAREIAGLLHLTLKKPQQEVFSLTDTGITVEIQNDLCARYTAITIEGITVGPSPAWLKARLESVGQKSINNIVDSTNFILLDTGQPVHVFDAAKVDGGIVVRSAHEGERFITLSGEEKVLSEHMLVIADYVGPLALAGVKGGKSAEVTDATTAIIIEIANFDATSVRKTSRALNLITDASKRFENTVSPELIGSVIPNILSLIHDVAGGSVVASRDVYKNPRTTRTLSFTTKDIVRVLGASGTTAAIREVFDGYQYVYEEKEDVFTLDIPFWRNDITGAHDIAEEIGRVTGYDTIASKPLPFTPTIEKKVVDETIQAVKKYLVDKGFSEVMNYTFRKKGEWYVARGPKDKSALRSNLSDGLKESFDLNKRNAPLLGIQEVNIFEIGTVFLTDHEEIHVATAENGTFVEQPLEQFVADHDVNTSNANDLHIENPEKRFTMWSIYPFIVRDVAVWLPKGDDDAKQSLDKVMNEFARGVQLRAPVMFDSFEKEESVSYAYRFIFQSFRHTLTDDEVAKMIAPLFERIAAIAGVTLR